MTRGRLRVYLGAAPGVGKTYAMLAEGRRRHGRGTDVVIGYVETPSIAEAQAGMALTEVNARWQAEMAEFFEDLEGRAPDEGFLVLEEIFHLEDQLSAVSTTDALVTEQATKEEDRR